MGFMDGVGVPARPPGWHENLLDTAADMGLSAISWVGGTLDKYDNAFRNLIGGRPGAALRSAIPFSDTLGIYDPETDYMSGQELLRRFGLLDQGADKPLLSAEGGLGLAAELVAAPSNLLPGFFGIKALTKAGKLAGKVAPHLDEVSSLANALKAAKKADATLGATGGAFTKSATEALAERLAALEGRFGGKVLDAADNALPENELMRMLSGQASNLGQEAAYLERGGLAPRLGKTAAERARAGQEALFSIGGEYRPFGIGPKIDIPQIDLVTSPWLQQGISDVGGMIRNAPGIKQALDLFKRSPVNTAVKQAKGLQEQVAREGAATVDEAERLFQAGQFDEAAKLLGGDAPLPTMGQSVSLPGAVEQAAPTQVAGGIPTQELLEAEGRVQSMMKEVARVRDAGGIPLQRAEYMLKAAQDDFNRLKEAIGSAPPQSVASVPTMITKDMQQQLLDLGYSKQAIAAMRPEEAHAILGRPSLKNAKAPTQTIYQEPVPAFEPLGRARKPMLDARLRGHSNEMLQESLSKVERSIADLEAQINVLPRSTPELNKQLGELQDIRSTIDHELFYRSAGEMPSKNIAEALVSMDLSTASGKTKAVLLLAAAQRRGLGYEIQSAFEKWGRGSTNKKLLRQLERLKDISNDFDYIGKPVPLPDIADAPAPKVEDISERLKALWSMPPKQAAQAAKNVLDPQTAAKFEAVAPVVQETQQRVARATGITAPEINKMASDFIKDGTAPEAAASMLRALGDGVEGGAVPKELESAVNSVRRNYKEMLDFEQPWTGLKDLGDPYAMHAVTKQGRQFFESVAKAGPEAQQRFLDALNEVRAAKGLDPLAIGAESVGVRGTPIRAATGKASGEAARLLERAGIGEAFIEEAMNGSMYARKYRGLTVNEINDVAKKFGAKADVFESNTFKQLKQRGLQHAKIRGMVEFVEGLEGLGVAKKVSAADVARSTPDAKFPGVSHITMTSGTSGYVSDILQQGGTGNNIVFETAKEAAEAGQALRWMADDGKMAPALKWYDQATRIMKSAMTRGFPSFHMRNRFENRIKSNLQDVPFFGQHNRLGELASQGKDFSVKLDDGTTMNYASLMSELRAMPQHKILSAGQIESITKEVADSLAAASAKVGKFSLMDRLEGITEKVVNKIEPFAAAPAVAAGKISSGVSPLTKGYNGAALENADKLRHYIYKRMKGYAPEAAAADVMEAQFDYTKSAMNSFERDFMNRTLLFYGYTRSVIPFMVEQIAKNSGKVTPWLRLANVPGKDENLPPWLREGLAVPLYTDEKAGLTQYARSLGTPFEAAVEPFAGFFAPGNAVDKLQRGGQKMAAGLNPLIKAPAEFLFEKDLFLGRDIEALRKFPEWSRKLPQSVKDALGLREITSKEGKYLRMEGNAWGAWALRNSPLGRLSGTIGKGMDERKAVNDVLLNLFTGANVTTFDKEREARFRQREAAIRQLKELEKLGLTKEFTAWRTTDEGKDSEEARALLNLLAGR